MLRVSVVQSSSQTVTLRVEGEVKGRWVAELRRACEESLSRDVRLILDLAGCHLSMWMGLLSFGPSGIAKWFLQIPLPS